MVFQNQAKLFDAIPLRNALRNIQQDINNFLLEAEVHVLNEETIEFLEDIEQQCIEALEDDNENEFSPFFGGRNESETAK